MEFNAEEFRKKAKAAGLSDSDIDSEISYQTGGKKDVFAKGSQGFELSSKEDLHSRLGNDWWHLPAAAIGVSSLASAGKAVYDWYKSQNTPPATRVEPTLAVEPVSEIAPQQPVNKLEQLQERVRAGREAGLGAPPPQTPIAPTSNVANVPQVGVQTPVQPTAAVQPPVAAPVAQQATPSVTEAVVAGQSPSKAIQTDVAQQLDEASGVAGRVRRTKAQIEQAAAEALANAPEGKLPAAPRKTNKMPGDVIGQGGWHWYEGQMGPQAEKAWLQEFGRTNQPYSRVVEAVKEGRLPVPAPTEGKKGGTFPRQEYVPEYIKGQASLAQLGALAANALGAAGLLQAYKQGKETGDYSDLGLGTIGQILGNIAPKAGLGLSLMAPTEVAPGTVTPIPKTKKEREKLYEERVGAGRGIMPPSMYQR